MVNILETLRARLPRYEIKDRLGSGGMATVYRAKDKNLGRDVAIKVLHEHLLYEEGFKDRFEQEARFIASFNHPNIVRVYDFETLETAEGKLYYMVMPYLAGKTLVEVVQECRMKEAMLSHERIKEIANDVAGALDYAHGRGTVHRDVKPANIIFDENNRAILTDFGIARLVQGANMTADGTILGTPAYMSPEQVTGQPIDHRSDIYSFACILFELLTGHTPFEDDSTVSLLFKHANDIPPAVSHFAEIKNPAIDFVLERALSKEADERYQKASDLAKSLQEAIEAESNTDRFKPASLPHRPNNFPSKKPAATQSLNESELSPNLQGNTISRTIQTLVIKPAKQNPLGFIALGVAIITLLFVARLSQSNTTAPVATEVIEISSVDSMTGNSPMYFVADFSAESELNSYWQSSADVMSRQIADGAYRLSTTERGRATSSLIDPAIFRFEDSYIRMEGQILDSSAAPTSAFGIIFRYQDAGNYYVFGVDGMGQFSIWKRENNAWCELRTACNGGENTEDWTGNEGINPIGENNVLSINTLGNNFVGYVNGIEVFNLLDETFAEGAVGIYMASSNLGGVESIITHYEVQTAMTSMTADSMTSDTDSMTSDSMTDEEVTEEATEAN